MVDLTAATQRTNEIPSHYAAGIGILSGGSVAHKYETQKNLWYLREYL